MEEAKNEKEEILREDIFRIHYPTCTPTKCQVTLTSSELILEEFQCDEDDISDSDIDKERYKIKDIFGLHIVQKDNEEPSLPTVYLCFIFYTNLENSSDRTRVPRIFEINESQHSYEGNLELAIEWALDIGQLVKLKFPNLCSHELQTSNDKGSSFNEKIEKAFEYLRLTRNNGSDTAIKSDCNKTSETSLELDFYDETFTLQKTLLFERNFLVIINPVSGQGKGISLFEEQISPVFADSGIKTELVTTEFAGHASNIIKKFDLSHIDGITAVGGDGLLNEIVNGIRSRSDSEKFTDIPIGIVATGSGNGLARTIAAYYGVSKEYRANPVLHSTLSVARGCIAPVNLTEVSLDKRKFYSFLSVGWGLLSDIDIESEVLRYIGEIRFVIWSFIRLFQLRRYKAELSYVPHDAKGSITSRVIVNDDFVSVYSACQSHIGSDMLFAPDAEPFDSTIHLTYLPSNTGRLQTAKFLAELIRDQGRHINVDPVKYVKVKEFTIRCENGIEGCLTVDGEQVKGEEIVVKMCDKPLFILAMG